MNKIEEALVKHFESHRIIFWYDEKKELLEQYEELKIKNTEKIYVIGNEFEVKYTVHKANPELVVGLRISPSHFPY